MRKLNNMKREITESIKYIIPIVIIFIGILILKNYNHIETYVDRNSKIILNILTPLIIGFIIAYILNKPMILLENKFKLKRPISVALIYLLVIISMSTTWLFLVPDIQANIYGLIEAIPQNIEQLDEIVNSINREFNLKISNQDARNQIDKFITNIVVPYSTVLANSIASSIIDIMAMIVSYIVNIFLGIVISIYLLISKEKSIESISILSSRVLGKYYKTITECIHILDKNIGTYIVAKAIDSTIYGIICVIILNIVGSEYALLIGIIAGITNMIPFFGPIIGTIVSVAINLFFSFDKAILILIVMIVVQQLESAILEPYFVGKQVGVPPVFTILAVTIASQYFGFMGILLSVPVTGVILMYINRYIEKEKLNKI